MKKFTAILSLVAIIASALFVTSCAQKKEPTLVPAFPYNKTANYVQNEDSGEYSWTWESADGYTNAKGGGFGVVAGTAAGTNHFGTHILEYRIVPNAEWTAEIVGQGTEYIEMGQGHSFDENALTWGTTGKGDRGLNSLYFRVIKTPESYEEAFTCEVALSMCGEKMVIGTLIIEPRLY